MAVTRKQQDRHNCQKAGPTAVTRAILLSPTSACQAFREAHQGTHYGRETLLNWLVFCPMSESPSGKREGFQDNATRKREVYC